MRKFKVLCDFGGGGFNDDDFMSWEIVESETGDYDEIVAKAKALFTCEIEVDEAIEIFDTPLNNKYVLFDSADGFTYGVPVMFFAEKRAYRYCDEFEQDMGRSMIEDTLPLFESNPSEIIDFAKGNFNWDDVKNHAIKMERKDKPKPDYQEEWLSNDFFIK